MDEKESLRLLAAVALFVSFAMGALFSLIFGESFLFWFAICLGGISVGELIYTWIKAHRK